MCELNLKIITEAYNRGDDITDYLSHKYNKQQVQEIKTALKQGVDISLLTKYDYTASQMQKIRLGFKYGLTPQEISVYAKPNIPANVMHKLMCGLVRGCDVSILADLPLDHKQMEEAIKWLEDGIEIGLIKKYIKPERTKSELKQLRYAILWKFTEEQIKRYERYILSECDDLQQTEIRLAVKYDFTDKQLDFIAKPEHSWELIQKLREAIQQGISIDLLQKAINKGLTHKHIGYILALDEKGVLCLV